MNSNTANIDRRTRIAVRWTTDPACFGYADTDEQAAAAQAAFQAAKPDFVGTPRTALAYMAATSQEIGVSTYMRVEYSIARDGTPIDAYDLRDIVG
jgi:hypothetical protein